MPRAAAQGGDLAGADGFSLMRMLGISERAQRRSLLAGHAPNANAPVGRAQHRRARLALRRPGACPWASVAPSRGTTRATQRSLAHGFIRPQKAKLGSRVLDWTRVRGRP